MALDAAEDTVNVPVTVFDNFWSDGTRVALLTLTHPDGTVDTASLVITDDDQVLIVRGCPFFFFLFF